MLPELAACSARDRFIKTSSYGRFRADDPVSREPPYRFLGSDGYSRILFCKVNATASVRLETPSLERILLT